MKKIVFAFLAWMACFVCLTACGEEIVLTFGGDCVLGTREEWKGLEDTFDSCIESQGMAYPFSGVSTLFANDDLTMVNLECVLQENNRSHDNGKQHTFRGDPSYASMLKMADIELVGLANNHTSDYRSAGFASTKDALAQAQVAYSGCRELYVLEAQGYKVGFGGCRETTFLQNKAIIYRDIQKLKKQGCDVIVYACHWGKEYSPTHNATQQRMAQYAVNSGADLIIGTHPHVVQGVEARTDSRGKHCAAVVYSLGNLVFGGTHEMQTFDAMLLQATLRFEDSKYIGAQLQLIPVLTSGSAPANDFRPILAQGEDKARILGLVQDDSELEITESMWFSRSK